MDIEFNEQRRKLLIEKVQVYFTNEMDESIGELKAGFLVDFFLEQMGAAIYNQAIDDAHAFIQDKLIDLEGTLYLPE